MVIHHLKWPVPSGPVEPHPERLAISTLPSPERATREEGDAATRPMEAMRATMVEKRIVATWGSGRWRVEERRRELTEAELGSRAD